MPYDLDTLQADIAQIQNEGIAAFGTGRLVATNLVLTSAHVLFDRSRQPALDGWSVRLARDRREGAPWPFRTGNRVLWHGTAAGVDIALILLVDPPDGPVLPRLGLRVASVTGNNPHAVEARGYPSGAKSTEGPRDMIPAFGLLIGAYRDKPLRFGVEASDLPRRPHEDWPGMSGSAVLLREPPAPGLVWVYGVVQQVPANFIGQLQVARLADAWADAAFRRLLVSAGAPDLDAEDPSSAIMTRPRGSSVVDTGIEILRLLRTTRTTFEAQARVRDQLVWRITGRLAIDPSHGMTYEDFLATHFDAIDGFEKRKFQLIRSFTERVLHDCNARIKDLIKRCPELVSRVPKLGNLYDHYEVWLTKFSAVFVNAPDMALLYTGPAEGVPFPEGVENDLWRFLTAQPGASEALAGEPEPPSASEFREATEDPSGYQWFRYLEAVWARNQLDMILGAVSRAKSEGYADGSERIIAAEVRLADLMNRALGWNSRDAKLEAAKLAIRASCTAAPGQAAGGEFNVLWTWAVSLASVREQIVRFKTDREKEVPQDLASVWPVIRATLLERLREQLDLATGSPTVRDYWEFGPLAELSP